MLVSAMQDRSSKIAEFHGYTLIVAVYDPSGEASDWTMKVLLPYPNGQRLGPIDPLYSSQARAQEAAQTLVRGHAKSLGNLIPEDARPEWKDQ